MKNQIVSELNSTILMLKAHPDNKPNSEFEDRITSLQESLKRFRKETKWEGFESHQPICYETGEWDGYKSDIILCKNKNDENIFIAECYEGILDGSPFFHVCNGDDSVICEENYEWRELF